jgi:hypothetical protein
LKNTTFDNYGGPTARHSDFKLFGAGKFFLFYSKNNNKMFVEFKNKKG